jgi:hypothetical protein
VSLGNLPSNDFILCLFARETAGHAATIAIGSTSGASDVMPAYNVSASTGATISQTGFNKTWFSAGSTQQLFATVTGASASVNVEVFYLPGN